MWHWQDIRGFTLVEMAVVLAVVALITGMSIVAGMEALESTRRVATDSKLDVIEDALMAFRKKHNRLPCPGNATLAASNSNYGLEADYRAATNTCYTGGTILATYVTTSGVSGVPSGAVPVRSLGLPDDFMYDAWGRKFMYEVTPAMTMDNAFSAAYPGDNCSITVYDHSNSALPILPVYALVSYGKNGIGGYLKSGSQFTDGQHGDDELRNMRGASYTTAPYVRLKNGTSGAIGTSGYYDDMVRFKSLYQMMDKNQRDAVIYKGPDMVLAYNTTSGTQMTWGKKKCGKFQGFSGTTPAAVAASPKFLAFTASNSNLFVYHTNVCKLYSIVGTTVAAVSASTPVPNCPAAATAGAMAQAGSMLALNHTATPYARVWLMKGSGASAIYQELPHAFDPPLAATPEHLSFSDNGEYLAVSRHSATSYARLYKRRGDRYVAVTALNGSSAYTKTFQPGQSYSIYSNAISPDGRYYAVTDATTSASNTRIYVWRNVSGNWSQVLSGGSAILYTVTGMSAPNYLGFSHDSQHLAVSGTSSANNIAVLHINPRTEAISTVLAATRGTVPVNAAFSPDSMFMNLAMPTTGSNALSIYRRSGASSYVLDTSSTSSMTYNGAANGAFIAYSR